MNHEVARHPIWRVFDWQRRLDEDKALTKVQTCEQEGFFPRMYRTTLRISPPPGLIRAFSVRQLMGVAKTSVPHDAFQKLGCVLLERNSHTLSSGSKA